MTQPATTTTLRTGHIGLNVTDLDRSRAFYQRVFGFEAVGEGADGDQRWAFLGRDGAITVTLWQQSQGRFPTATPGLHHLAFQVDSVREVHDIEQELRALDAEFTYEGVVPHREGASSGGIFFLDPDGIRLEVSTASGAETGTAPHGTAPTCGFF
ncbi:VOC family protein [Kitasatospora nipponensis]|uniref:VOC family protein n=1 Tax=Kitasatospora nipponensis TaxID=258049 RepID=A0ABP4GJ43_9ACTN